jgi:glycosyltransferase involved in cell wall biosynthesis
MIVCNSSVETDLLAKRGIREDRLVSIGPGVDPMGCLGGDGARFRRVHGIDGPIVLQLGTQTHEKGSHHTAEAICHLRNKGLPVTGVFLGFVRDDFDKGYLSQKSGHELAGLVALGEVDDAAKRDALAAAQMVCMPSTADSFGISFLEGWLLGLPALGAFAGGIPKAINDGKDGFLVPFGDWHMLAEYIELLIKNADLARNLGEAGRNKVWTNYTWQKVLKRFKDHVYPLLPKRPGM